MERISTSKERAAAKRRATSIERGIAYLNTALALIPGVRRGTAEKRVREAAQPMTAAKALVKEFHSRKSTSSARPRAVDDRAVCIQTAFAMELGHSWPEGHQDGPPGNHPDLSAATEARSTLLRLQPSALRCAYEDELGEVERALLNGSLSQRAFDKRCHKISEKPLPNWMDKNQSPAIAHPTKIQGYGPYPDKIDMPPVPLWLKRYKATKYYAIAAE